MIPRAGELRDFAYLLMRDVPTPDDFGQSFPRYTTGRNLWIRVVDLSGGELIAAQQVVASATSEIHCRWQDANQIPAIRAMDQISLGTLRYEVSAVIQPDGPRDVTRILCRRVLT